MRNLKIIALLLLPLLGCFAQIEDQSVALSHNLCGGTSNCMPAALPLGLIQISGQNTFTVNFGDQPLLQLSSSLGPATLNTSLILNGAGVRRPEGPRRDRQASVRLTTRQAGAYRPL